MAATDINRGNTSDFLRIEVPAAGTINVIEGPNLKEAPDNLGQANQAGGKFQQEDASRRKITGVQKIQLLDDSVTLPEGGEVWDRTTNDASAGDPESVRIDNVDIEGQTEDGYEVYSISFHYFEDITNTTLARADMGLT